MTEKPLSEKDIKLLRQYGLLKVNETAVSTIDLVMAVDLQTQERRVLKTEGLLLESTRQLLKG